MILFNKWTLAIALLCCLTSQTACNSLNRHPDSGYSTYGGQSPLHKQLEYERKIFKESKAREELGYGTSYPLNESQEVIVQRRLTLKGKEKELTTQREMKQYYHYKPMMNSDQERIYFLSLPSIESRERFVQQRGLASKMKEISPDIASQIEENDISVGMTQKSVLESWGDPDRVEVAGNPVYGNERWKYSKYVSSEAGYRRETRYVYFENGVVSGWESF